MPEKIEDTETERERTKEYTIKMTGLGSWLICTYEHSRGTKISTQSMPVRTNKRFNAVDRISWIEGIANNFQAHANLVARRVF